jgi:hypothetical protein
VARESVASRKQPDWLAPFACLILFWGILWLYAPSLRFGLIWDDPEWFGRVVGRSLGDLLRPSPDFQFYRPGTMLYNRLFVGADGLLAVHGLHWLQIGWHLLNVAAVLTISRLMGFSFWAAYAVALLVGVYPFSHQAVGWAAPQQPLVFALQTMAWLFFLRGRHHAGRGPDWPLVVSLLLFGLALTVQEVTAPYALLPLVFEVVLRRQTAVSPSTILASFRHPMQNGWLRPLAYPLLALIFLIFWGLAPREGGITRLGLDGGVTAYLSQGFSYPLVWLIPHDLGGHLFWLSTAVFLTLLLWGVAVWRGRGLLATAGLLWAFLGLTPALFGLPFSYVQYAPRLLYYAAPGIAWLWVCALWPTAGAGRRQPAAWLGLAVLGFIALGSVRQVADFQRLYAAGTDHLQELVAEIGGSNGRFLFLNFPDRYAPREAPYPLGYWGVTLAPVVVELGEFPGLLVGGAAQTASHSLPWIDFDQREQGPYAVDMRGVILQPEELYELAGKLDVVYLTRYLDNGRFLLQRVGSLYPQAAGSCALARFGEDICLHAVHVSQQADDGRWRVRLFWSAEAELEPHLTIFAHLGQVGQPPLDQQDGDAWRGALPMRYWQPGDLIDDQRAITNPAQPGDFSLQIGVYNRLTGERLLATDGSGQPLPDNAFSRLLFPDEGEVEVGDWRLEIGD